MSLRFVAIDFETADHGRDSACALALVVVSGGEIIERHSFLIRPPRPAFVFTWVHGLTWEDCKGEQTFAERYEHIERVLAGADFVAAHNASFDAGVMAACCREAGLRPPTLPMICTVRLSRRVFGLRRANLPAVCEHLGIALRHHEALSDAEACARIVMAAGDAEVMSELSRVTRRWSQRSPADAEGAPRRRRSPRSRDLRASDLLPRELFSLPHAPPLPSQPDGQPASQAGEQGGESSAQRARKRAVEHVQALARAADEPEPKPPPRARAARKPR